jgi:hypothetical protein
MLKIHIQLCPFVLWFITTRTCHAHFNQQQTLHFWTPRLPDHFHSSKHLYCKHKILHDKFYWQIQKSQQQNLVYYPIKEIPWAKILRIHIIDRFFLHCFSQLCNSDSFPICSYYNNEKLSSSFTKLQHQCNKTRAHQLQIQEFS